MTSTTHPHPTMSERLRQFAESDTPEVVTIPPGWPGVIMWAIGRFGTSIVMAIVAIWGLTVVYQDMRADSTLDRTASNEALQKIATTLEVIDKRLQHIERHVPTQTSTP